MEVVTRYAPTISGELHIGGLYNALLNYLFAKRYNGLFKLRLDGMDLNPPHDVWQQNIPRDLERFGLYPDETVVASERIETYKEVARSLDKTCERSYHCDCTVNDMLERARGGSKFYHLYRPEKYPPHCRVSLIEVLGVENETSLSTGCKVSATHEATEHPAACLTGRLAKSNIWWEPVDVGYQYRYKPEVTIDLGSKQAIRGVRITWKDRPALEYWLYLDDCLVAVVTKVDQHFVEYKQGQPFLPLQSDVQQFAPREARFIKIRIRQCAVPVDKPYFYDYHCRGLGKRLDLSHKDTVLRLIADENISDYDTAYWYSRMPNLVLTSSYDDMQMGITHCIRGIDIEPWVDLEEQVSRALSAPVRRQLAHGLLIDKRGYKYSKWIKSTPVREYLCNGVTAEMVLTYIARKAGLVETNEVLELSELVKCYGGEIPEDNIRLDEREMLEELRS